jgi:hypothetical protein
VGCVEADPASTAPDLPNVSFEASISATALIDAINAPYILYVMARTNSLVTESIARHARPGL